MKGTDHTLQQALNKRRNAKKKTLTTIYNYSSSLENEKIQSGNISNTQQGKM